MIELLAFSLAVSLCCITIHICVVWPGMIFNWAEKYLQVLPHYLRKPLYECTTCMCSIWTLAFWCIYPPAVSIGIAPVIITVLITGALNTIFCLLLNETDYGC